MFKQQFLQDACRWVEQGQVVPLSALRPGTVQRLLYTHLPLRAMAWYRYGSWCKARGVRLIPGFIQRMLFTRFGFEIAIGADIAGGLYVPHPVGCVIAVDRIGENCSIIAAVTIGMRNEWKFPRIGNRVFIGAGARVLGGITIGDDAVIGANAVVIRDVAEATTVVGIPARPVGVPHLA